jgi:hypothetical protein
MTRKKLPIGIQTFREIRDGLRKLYSVIKEQDAHIKFALLTGVSRFGKENLFSGLNNLLEMSELRCDQEIPLRKR